MDSSVKEQINWFINEVFFVVNVIMHANKLNFFAVYEFVILVNFMTVNVDVLLIVSYNFVKQD